MTGQLGLIPDKDALPLQEVITTTEPTSTPDADMIPRLYAEIRRLRARLARTLADLHNLVAAARATLSAHDDGEDDALYYLRDELHAQGRDHRERP